MNTAVALGADDIPEEMPIKRPKPPLSLSEQEKQTVLDVLHSERFCDTAPPSGICRFV
jgi:hypothetical protein